MLATNVDLFAWSVLDKRQINLEFHCHKLAICLEARLIAQRKMKLNLERGKVMYEEANKSF